MVVTIVDIALHACRKVLLIITIYGITLSTVKLFSHMIMYVYATLSSRKYVGSYVNCIVETTCISFS